HPSGAGESGATGLAVRVRRRTALRIQPFLCLIKRSPPSSCSTWILGRSFSRELIFVCGPPNGPECPNAHTAYWCNTKFNASVGRVRRLQLLECIGDERSLRFTVFD